MEENSLECLKEGRRGILSREVVLLNLGSFVNFAFPVQNRFVGDETVVEVSADTRRVVRYIVPLEALDHLAWPNSHRFKNFLGHQERLISPISGNTRIHTFQLGDPTELE